MFRYRELFNAALGWLYKTVCAVNLLGSLRQNMKTVFILEDEVGIQEVLELLLSSQNYNVVTFSTVKEFNCREMAVQPDLFMLDVMLPDGLGTEVCRELKCDPITSKVPVLLMSAHAKIIKTDDPHSADDFMSKPFDINDVISKVDKLTALQA
ncbi:two-component system phosphate regulon response regulator PhoB [Sphingobacterium zeae]|uniref:Two-component system phosphate regulon response regulator PhoB n=2 Tax=Sphingobacterium zeae TaxID=1776859 RepID=A0ABU0U731_9SPHI|nr:two-component system phosphate regulon response regulator PhoB [Sphingobacterium zeae]